MSAMGSVTLLVRRLTEGDRDAVQHLFDRYFQRLVALARARLQGQPRRVADEDDAALSAFGSCCRRIEAGRFDDPPTDRDSLWRLLARITVCKALDLIANEKRQKRGGGTVLGEEALLGPGDGGEGLGGLDQVLEQEPTPLELSLVAEQINRLMHHLGSEELRIVARLKLEGYTNEEIARSLDRIPRAIERRLQFIREIWQQVSQP